MTKNFKLTLPISQIKNIYSQTAFNYEATAASLENNVERRQVQSTKIFQNQNREVYKYGTPMGLGNEYQNKKQPVTKSKLTSRVNDPKFKPVFFNGCFDKNRIKLLVSWSLQNCGQKITIDLIENLKNLGFSYATQAGISLGIDDLKIPPTKNILISTAEKNIKKTYINYKKEYLSGVEKFQHLIDTWHRTSEILKQDVISYFKLTDILNPVYMMAFSGARGNVSQVRQLVGMRGLMSDPQGQILDFPIKSNFREGITLTEYIISCYGARKGLVDTALKTANSGYLTRRLVDVSHHIIVSDLDCKTRRGVVLADIIENKRIIVPLKNRLIGRILSENIYSNNNVIGEISDFKNVKYLSAFAEYKQKLIINFGTFKTSKHILGLLRYYKSKSQNDPTVFSRYLCYEAGRYVKVQSTKSSVGLGQDVAHLHFPGSSEQIFPSTTSQARGDLPLKRQVLGVGVDFLQNAKNLLRKRTCTMYVPASRAGSRRSFGLGFQINSLLRDQVRTTLFFYLITKFKVLTTLHEKAFADKSLKNPLQSRERFAPSMESVNFLHSAKNQRQRQLDFNVSTNISLENTINKTTVFQVQSEILKRPSTEYVIFSNYLTCYTAKKKLLAQKNQEISVELSVKIANLRKSVLVRSPLTCEIKNSICQLCYGWSLAHGKLVSLGEAVGVLAAQSIGEPGTQLTMRTFHTGGVFSGDIMSEITAPFNGIILFSNYLEGMLIRTPHGKIAFLTKIQGSFQVQKEKLTKKDSIVLQIPALTVLFVRNAEYVTKGQVIAEFSFMSTDANQRIEASQDLKAVIEGEVYFKNVILNIRRKKKTKKLVSRTTCNLGNIWILAGKICQQTIPINLFLQPGDFVNENSIIAQYETMSSYNGFSNGYSNLKRLRKNKSATCVGNTKIVQRLSPINQNSNFFKSKSLKSTKLGEALGILSNQLSGTNSFKNLNFNNKNWLHYPLISYSVQSIQYKKMGYLFSFFTRKKLQVNHSKSLCDSIHEMGKYIVQVSNINIQNDNEVISEAGQVRNISLKQSALKQQQFFLSNSLKQNFLNSNNLNKKFFFQSFPIQYKTQTGGKLIYDTFYLNKKTHTGEIFWISQETYLFNRQHSYTNVVNYLLKAFTNIQASKVPSKVDYQGTLLYVSSKQSVLNPPMESVNFLQNAKNKRPLLGRERFAPVTESVNFLQNAKNKRQQLKIKDKVLSNSNQVFKPSALQVYGKKIAIAEDHVKSTAEFTLFSGLKGRHKRALHDQVLPATHVKQPTIQRKRMYGLRNKNNTKFITKNNLTNFYYNAQGKFFVVYSKLSGYTEYSLLSGFISNKINARGSKQIVSNLRPVMQYNIWQPPKFKVKMSFSKKFDKALEVQVCPMEYKYLQNKFTETANEYTKCTGMEYKHYMPAAKRFTFQKASFYNNVVKTYVAAKQLRIKYQVPNAIGTSYVVVGLKSLQLRDRYKVPNCGAIKYEIQRFKSGRRTVNYAIQKNRVHSFNYKFYQINFHLNPCITISYINARNLKIKNAIKKKKLLAFFENINQRFCCIAAKNLDAARLGILNNNYFYNQSNTILKTHFTTKNLKKVLSKYIVACSEKSHKKSTKNLTAEPKMLRYRILKLLKKLLPLNKYLVCDRLAVSVQNQFRPVVLDCKFYSVCVKPTIKRVNTQYTSTVLFSLGHPISFKNQIAAASNIKYRKVYVKVYTKQRFILLRPQFPWKNFSKKNLINTKNIKFNGQEAIQQLQSKSHFANTLFFNEQEKKILHVKIKKTRYLCKPSSKQVVNSKQDFFQQSNSLKQNLIKVAIKPGWVYLQDTGHHNFLTQKQFGEIIKKDKKIIKPGEMCFINVSFDQHPVYYQCLSVKQISLQNNKSALKKNTTLQKQQHFANIYEKFLNRNLSAESTYTPYQYATHTGSQKLRTYFARTWYLITSRFQVFSKSTKLVVNSEQDVLNLKPQTNGRVSRLKPDLLRVVVYKVSFILKFKTSKYKIGQICAQIPNIFTQRKILKNLCFFKLYDSLFFNKNFQTAFQLHRKYNQENFYNNKFDIISEKIFLEKNIKKNFLPNQTSVEKIYFLKNANFLKPYFLNRFAFGSEQNSLNLQPQRNGKYPLGYSVPIHCVYRGEALRIQVQRFQSHNASMYAVPETSDKYQQINSQNDQVLRSKTGNKLYDRVESTWLPSYGKCKFFAECKKPFQYTKCTGTEYIGRRFASTPTLSTLQKVQGDPQVVNSEYLFLNHLQNNNKIKISDGFALNNEYLRPPIQGNNSTPNQVINLKKIALPVSWWSAQLSSYKRDVSHQSRSHWPSFTGHIIPYGVSIHSKPNRVSSQATNSVFDFINNSNQLQKNQIHTTKSKFILVITKVKSYCFNTAMQYKKLLSQDNKIVPSKLIYFRNSVIPKVTSLPDGQIQNTLGYSQFVKLQDIQPARKTDGLQAPPARREAISVNFLQNVKNLPLESVNFLQNAKNKRQQRFFQQRCKTATKRSNVKYSYNRQRQTAFYMQLWSSNKQNITHLFFASPAPDFYLKTFFKYRHCKNIVFYKNISIFQYYLSFIIPNIYKRHFTRISFVPQNRDFQTKVQAQMPSVLPTCTISLPDGRVRPQNDFELSLQTVTENTSKLLSRVRSSEHCVLNQLQSDNKITIADSPALSTTYNLNLTSRLNVFIFLKVDSYSAYKKPPYEQRKTNFVIGASILKAKNDHRQGRKGIKKIQLFFSSQNYFAAETPLSYTNLLSEYHGEILNSGLLKKNSLEISNTKLVSRFETILDVPENKIEKQNYLILTSNEQVNFYIDNIDNTEMTVDQVSVYFSTDMLLKSKRLKLKPTNNSIFLRKNIRYGTKINFEVAFPGYCATKRRYPRKNVKHFFNREKVHSTSTTYSQNRFAETANPNILNSGTSVVIPLSGTIIQIEKPRSQSKQLGGTIITVRKAQPILFSSKGLVSVYEGDIIEKNTLVLRLFYQRLKTGDIVQGIPKIEQLFEARKTNQGEFLHNSLHQQLEKIFLYYIYLPADTTTEVWGSQLDKFSKASRYSLSKIQEVIVSSVQKVYRSQGVTIADKHLEIIIRQMTSKVQVIRSGQTNLLPGEIIDLDWIEIANEGIEDINKKAKYVPVILGITRKSLETKSFISEASFQETTRVLAKSAIERKTDFLKGLKENVILGNLIPAGTGLLSLKKNELFLRNKQFIKKGSVIQDELKSYTIFRNLFKKKTADKLTSFGVLDKSGKTGYLFK